MATKSENTGQHGVSTFNRLLMRDPDGGARHSWTSYQQHIYETLKALEAEGAGGTNVWNPNKEFDIVLGCFMAERAARR